MKKSSSKKKAPKSKGNKNTLTVAQTIPEGKRLWVEYIDIQTLKPMPLNPKDHDLGVLFQSMERFGFVAPMIIDEHSGLMVAGHGRLKELKMLKQDRVEAPKGIVVCGGKWFAPVIRGNWFKDLQEAKAYLLADNKISELGGWQIQESYDFLTDLLKSGHDLLVGTGFEESDIQSLHEILNKSPIDLEEDHSEPKSNYMENSCPKCGYTWKA